MFQPPSRQRASPPPSSVRRSLHDRIIETLHYFGEEVEGRRVGGLGEAQAAGYIAGRLRRADYSAAVQSFKSGIGEQIPLAARAVAGGVCGRAAAPVRERAYGALLVALAAVCLGAVLALLLAESGVLPAAYGPLRRLSKGKTSQNVIAGRPARGKKMARRLLIIAPLDGPPRPALQRQGLLLLLAACGVELMCVLGLLLGGAPALRSLTGVSAVVVALLGIWVLARRVRFAPLPAIYGAGELTALAMIAEELEPLQSVEVWVLALGGSTVGSENIRTLLAHYPFAPAETCVINLHNLSGGQPVFVTREGLLRERRSDRMLLAAAAETDAADITIDAEPRRLRERTLAHALLLQGYRTLTISSHSHRSLYTSPDPETIERCVRLVLGMVRALDR